VDCVAEGTPTGIAPVLQVHPSRRCNIACAHCYTASGPYVGEELPRELLLASLEDAVGLGYRQLAVSGGEPLLYQRLAELLAKARALGMVTTITTNGMLATARRWEPLAPLLDVVAISVDGTPEEHDTIRRREGAFERTLAGMGVVRSSGVAFGLIFTLTQHNVDSLEFVVRLAAEQGARSVQVHPLTIEGRAVAMLPNARPDGLELVVAITEAARLGRELGVVVHVDALTIEQLVAHRGQLVPERPVRALVAAAPVLAVAADGSVIPLTHDVSPARRLGSLHDAPLAALARTWLDDGRADALAADCERTWRELSGRPPLQAVYWYDEVAARTRLPAAA
jgi:MoaA/NifB/PqqE/SkfB family radical SAM enzyme